MNEIGFMHKIERLLLFLMLSSCSVEILETPHQQTTDTSYTTRTPVDTTEITNIPIGFDVYIENWY